MRKRFHTCDVFTDTRFGGNPLAVLPDATGLSDDQMQQIAREFNFSETAFVLPAEEGHTRRVRIFTPFDEVPFAGHPNIGTAFVLASTGELGRLAPRTTVTFEEQAGLVRIDIEAVDGVPHRCELAAPEALRVGASVPAEPVAALLSLPVDDLDDSTHPPLAASVGLPFLIVEVRGLDALRRVRIQPAALHALGALGAPLALHAYVRGEDPSNLRARAMIAEGGYEDPATGSANCALAALLAHLDVRPEGDFHWRITQGVEMGRPSVLFARARKSAGRVTSSHVAGQCVLVSEGLIDCG